MRRIYGPLANKKSWYWQEREYMKQDLIAQRRQLVGLKSSFGCARTFWRWVIRNLVIIAPFRHFAASIAVQEGVNLPISTSPTDRTPYQGAISDKPKPILPYS